jgi:hypothetical protein
MNAFRLPGCLGPIVVWVGLFFLAGCATPRADWEGRIGVFTFDQAVAELGPPDKSATLEDGTRVADWVDRRRGSVSFGLGVGAFGRRGGIGVGTGVGPEARGRVLRLTFGSDGKLKAWKRN